MHQELVSSPLTVSGVGNYGDVNNLKPTTCLAQMIVGSETGFLKRGDILLDVHEKSCLRTQTYFRSSLLSTSLVGFFLGGEKRRPEMRLCPQAN